MYIYIYIYISSNLIFSVFTSVPRGSILCHLFFLKNNLLNDIVSTMKQFIDDKLISFIDHKAKTEAYELD